MFYFGCNACNARWQIGEARTCTCMLEEKPQRTWVGLTDDERDRIWSSHRVSFEAIDHIEAKLKEKNNV